MLEVSYLTQNKHVHHENNSSNKSNQLDYIIAYTTVYVDMLLTCSKQRINYQQHLLPPLKKFIKYLYSHTKLSHSVLIVTLIYLERLKSCLPSHSQGGKTFFHFITILYKKGYLSIKNRVRHTIQNVNSCDYLGIQIYRRPQYNNSLDL
jgi:hypothetical protein